MVDINRLLNPDDVEILAGPESINWIPERPRDVILPYIEKSKKEDDPKGIETRRTQAKEVIDGYGRIIEKCKQMESTIEQRCKNVSVTLNKSEHLRVIDAIGRLFGVESEIITFEMYKQCIQRIEELTADRVPSLGV
jgi:hypothetical protein